MKEFSFMQRNKGLTSNFCLRKGPLNVVRKIDGEDKTEGKELVRLTEETKNSGNEKGEYTYQ